MSQVVVTNDRLKEKRAKSKDQERAIVTDDYFKKWKRSDVTGTSNLERLIGVAALPVVAFWALLVFLSSLSASVVMWVFRIISRLFPANLKK